MSDYIATPAQAATISDLTRWLDALEVAADPDPQDGPARSRGWLVYEGVYTDGPTVGYIRPDGTTLVVC